MKHISLLDIFYSLRKKLIILSTLAFLLVAIFYIVFTKPIYNPSAVVKVNVFEINPKWVSEIAGQVIVPSTPLDKVGTQIEAIRILMGEVFREKGINLDFKIPEKLLSVEERKTIVDTIKKNIKFRLLIKGDSIFVFRNKEIICKGTFDETINCSLFSFKLKKLKDFDKEVKGSIVYKNYPKTENYWSKKKVSVKQEGITDLVRITVFDKDRFYASDISNTIANKYIQWSSEQEKRIAKMSINQLQELLNMFDKSIDSIKNLADTLRLDKFTLVSYLLEFKGGISSEATAEFIRRLINNPNDYYLREIIERFYKKDIDFARLNNHIVTYLKKRDSILSSILDMEIAMAKTVSPAYVASYASPPYEPFWPKREVLILFSIFTGLLFGMIVSIVYDFISNRISNILQLKKWTFLDNVKFYYNFKDFQLYVKTKSSIKLHFNESIEGFKNYSKDEADEYVVLVKRNIDVNSYLELISNYSDKKCNIILL
ncbi:MAG: Wzz/FepE/Etk N-terminal domain-containing protein [candidate division WOR-3 bacterium]|nr:Wzz/FepE/Etk N-terminal domain-containing protein [candidate division WOR-3 bacterium]